MTELQIGYCTNVHAGTNWHSIMRNLDRYTVPIKHRFRPDGTLGVGLWISASLARQLLTGDRLNELANSLVERDLLPFTLNGFPYGDFHDPIVKHQVYQPDWSNPLRRDYTHALATILHRLLPPGIPGTISTLPLGWPPSSGNRGVEQQAAIHLREVAHALGRLESETGRTIRLAIEPEPGCILSGSADVVRFFEEVLFLEGEESILRRHLGVCHDICHTAVIFESQHQALAAYQSAGIEVAKVQVSSAIHVPFENISPRQREEAVEQLRGFAEDRYLHQTYLQSSRSQRPATVEYCDDLPVAIEQSGNPAAITCPWRIHFHVPIFLERFGLLKTTRDEIAQCYTAARDQGVEHFEVETYAWNVLPQALRQEDLVDGIARELQWFENTIVKSEK